MPLPQGQDYWCNQIWQCQGKADTLCNSQANSRNSKPTISLSIFLSVSESNGPDPDGTFFSAHAYDSPIRVSVRGTPSLARALMMLATREMASLPCGGISCECIRQSQSWLGYYATHVILVTVNTFWVKPFTTLPSRLWRSIAHPHVTVQPEDNVDTCRATRRRDVIEMGFKSTD